MNKRAMVDVLHAILNEWTIDRSCQHYMATDKHDRPVVACSQSATHWCVYGIIRKHTESVQDAYAMVEYLNTFSYDMYNTNVIDVNDINVPLDGWTQCRDVMAKALHQLTQESDEADV